ncbi:hypothetical protein DMENIID0001_128820 [Sergentomyia squamirostris]
MDSGKVLCVLLSLSVILQCYSFPQVPTRDEISWENFWTQVNRLRNYYNFLQEVEQSPERVQRSTICANIWDDGCINGQVVGAGRDGGFLESGGTPGKRFIS